MRPSRRDFLKVAGVSALVPGFAPAAVVPERLTDYGSHSTDGRSVTVTSTTGQHLRITAYGGHVVRVRSIRGGESFFADDRYEMVDPASHAGMGGSLSIVDTGDSFIITTAPGRRSCRRRLSGPLKPGPGAAVRSPRRWRTASIPSGAAVPSFL